MKYNMIVELIGINEKDMSNLHKKCMKVSADERVIECSQTKDKQERKIGFGLSHHIFNGDEIEQGLDKE